MEPGDLPLRSGERSLDSLELRQLQAFVAVADELNFSRAARRLYLSQPTLSRRVGALERVLGRELLRRNTHRVELTAAGTALLERTRQILRQLDDAVSLTRSIGTSRDDQADQLWGPIYCRTGQPGGIEEIRSAYEELLALFPVPPDTIIRPVTAGGVPGLTLAPQAELDLSVLYLHGGAYSMGSAFGYRPFVAALTRAAKTAALVVDYRLAPEHPYPAAVRDAVAAYRWMLDMGTDPGSICVAGDSAGAHLALSLLQVVRDTRLPMPGRAALLCPWVDLAESRTLPGAAAAPHGRVRRRFAAAYLGDHPADGALVDPLRSDLRGLPPLLVQCGAADSMVEDARLLVRRARAHGVDARLDLYDVSTHFFQLFWTFLPEAVKAIDSVGEFVVTG